MKTSTSSRNWGQAATDSIVRQRRRARIKRTVMLIIATYIGMYLVSRTTWNELALQGRLVGVFSDGGGTHEIWVKWGAVHIRTRVAPDE